MQIVKALEAFAERGLEKGLDLSAFRVELQQALLVVGDVDLAVIVDLEAVRPAVVLNDKFPLEIAVNAEDTHEWNVHAPQPSVAIERRSLQKAVDGRKLPVRIRPERAPLLAELRRQRAPALDRNFFYFLERVDHGMRRRIGMFTGSDKEAS